MPIHVPIYNNYGRNHAVEREELKRKKWGRNAIKIVLPVPGMITLLLSGSYVQ